jgi:quinol monooxygenase YgiN
MIVVHMEYDFLPERDQEMRSLVTGVEGYARGFEGCEHFALSFPDDRPGVLLASEVWTDGATLRAHVAVAHDAPELAAWHALLTGMHPSLFTANALELSELQAQGSHA